MIRVIISGIYGKMGQIIKEKIKQEDNIDCIGGVDIVGTGKDEDIQVVRNIEEIITNADVVVDFSIASATMEKIPVCIKHKKGMVIGTTGFSDDELRKIKEASLTIPILLSSNMSIAINLLYKLVGETAEVLKNGFDIEIVEKHHRYKKDSPSGTAISVGRIIAEKRGTKPEKVFKMGRKGFDERKKGDITFHSVRGGKIVSDHEILFIGDNEIFKISHTAFSREIFLDGVIQGIYFISDKKSSLYDMQDVLEIK